VIRPAVLAGLSLLAAAWSAEGATVYRRGAVRPGSALAVLGGPAAKPGALIGGPAEARARLPGTAGSHTQGESKPHRRHAGAAQGAPSPVTAGVKSPQVAAAGARGASPVTRFERPERTGKAGERAARP
jgi:hypothetical protein